MKNNIFKKAVSSLLAFTTIIICISVTSASEYFENTKFNLNLMSSQSYVGIPGQVQTGAGNNVDVVYYEELSPQALQELNNNAATEFPNAIRLRLATGLYNCHSYAWYDQSTTNNVWMPYPGAFETDGVINVTNQPWNVGDIVVYKNGSESIHSMIITEVRSSGSLAGITVVSKWGAGGLFEHDGNYGPYYYDSYVVYRCQHLSYSLPIGTNNSSTHNMLCSYCKRSSVAIAHTFSESTWVTLNYHNSLCNSCGETHSFTHTLSRQGICYVCGGRGVSGSINSISELEVE